MKPFKKRKLIEKIAQLEHLEQTTINTYGDKYSILVTAALKKARSQRTDDLVKTLNEMISERVIARNTARLYKASLLNRVVQNASAALDKGLPIDEYESQYEQIETINTQIAAPTSKNTSALKLKQFPTEILDQIERMKFVDSSFTRFKNLDFVIKFIRANLVVGLRPIEWAEAVFFDYINSDTSKVQTRSSFPALCVSNAKNSQGRANGSERDIIFDNISVEQLGDIIQFTKILQANLDGYSGKDREKRANEIFINAQQTFNRVITKLKIPMSKRPTLYSTRHQCIANAKSSHLTDIEIAALFGHKTTETARMHYGKKIHGSGKVVIKPSKESIMKVKEQLLQNNLNNLQLNEESKDFAEQWLKGKF